MIACTIFQESVFLLFCISIWLYPRPLLQPNK